MATNAEIVEMQRKARAAAEGRKTLATRLRDVSPDAASTPCRNLCREAAEAVEYYERLLAQMRQDAKDEALESQRSAGSAYADGRHDGMEEARGW